MTRVLIPQRSSKPKFGKKLVDKNLWLPRSPDLNPCDFYLWGYLKSVVYNPLPKTLDDLKAIKNVLNSVFYNLEKRCELIISAWDGHIEIK